ncbi:MAG: glycoside hydrolase family 20 zincin-like fold domain-containing protein [Agriterribacter sp.]
MKLIIKYILFCCTWLFLCFNKSTAGDIQEFNRHFKLIPQPQKIEMRNGKGLSFMELKNISLKNMEDLPLLPAMLGNLPVNGITQKGTLSLFINPALTLPSDEGYVLEATDQGITLQAPAKEGLFYGLQTLNQLMEDARDQNILISPCRITDYPSIATRAVHIDMKHHLDPITVYYKIIDRLSTLKVNTVIFEFEDKLRYRKAAAVAAPQAVTIEEFIALSNYAKARNIEISPLVQGLGHASFILKHKEYAALRDDSTSDYVFDPLNPKTYELQFAMYEDAMEATPYGKYLHIGGDEVGMLGKSDASKKSGMKPLELQMYWLKKVTAFAVMHHRIPIFWDDMVFKLAGLYQTTYDDKMSKEEVDELWKKNKTLLDENIALFPEHCIYARWNYEAPDIPGNKLALDWYTSHGLSVMPSTAAQQSYLLVQRNASNMKAIQGFCKITAERKIDKILCTVWDDSAPNIETVWRGLYDFAWFSWNAKPIPEPQTHAAFRHRYFGPELSNTAYEFQNALEKEVVFWETALLGSGDRENYNHDFVLIDVPDIQKHGEWSEKYKQKIATAENAISVYGKIKEQIQKSRLLALRNRHALDVFEQINDLQIYPAKLLMLMRLADTTASPQQKKQAIVKLKQWVEDFPALRARFEKVYTVEHTLKNPDSFQYDGNPRAHWANVANNTDWLFFYELEMNKKLSAWLNN